MSHAINNMIFDINTPRKKMQQAADYWGNKERDHEECGWGFKGVGPIDFTDKVFSNAQAAEQYCDKQGYRICAVRFHLPPKESATAKKLRERFERLGKELHEMRTKNKFENYASSKATCKHCGSSINVDYLKKAPLHKVNKCLVCGESMLSPTELSRIESKRVAYEASKVALDEKIKLETSKNKDFAWMVHVEVHC